MKIVHISDIHIHDAQIAGFDPVERFRACLAHVEAHNANADVVMISGDLVHDGDRDAYVRLRDMLDASPLAPHIQLMIGNHDSRENFQAVFPTVPADENGFVQYTFDRAGYRLMCLDTMQPGTHAGRLCEQRLAWLSNELERARFDELPVLLFMHHNPMTVGVWSTDVIGLKEQEAFGEIVGAERDGIRHLFFGHCHYSLSGSLLGIPFSAPRSTCHPCWPEFAGKWAMGVGPMSPNYNVALLSSEAVVVHTIDFLHENDVVYIPLGEETSVKRKTP